MKSDISFNHTQIIKIFFNLFVNDITVSIYVISLVSAYMFYCYAIQAEDDNNKKQISI